MVLWSSWRATSTESSWKLVTRVLRSKSETSHGVLRRTGSLKTIVAEAPGATSSAPFLGVKSFSRGAMVSRSLNAYQPAEVPLKFRPLPSRTTPSPRARSQPASDSTGMLATSMRRTSPCTDSKFCVTDVGCKSPWHWIVTPSITLCKLTVLSKVTLTSLKSPTPNREPAAGVTLRTVGESQWSCLEQTVHGVLTPFCGMQLIVLKSQRQMLLDRAQVHGSRFKSHAWAWFRAHFPCSAQSSHEMSVRGPLRPMQRWLPW
mmetsp:Transcript_30360/g.86918  ORF Transcript_30360/g.86918 Transcript_30360/m.86918 type:complete len:260 (-) Transcript_30360:756-1535(-)